MHSYEQEQEALSYAHESEIKANQFQVYYRVQKALVVLNSL
jgi:hypothetical protein